MQKQSSARIPTKYGNFDVIAFASNEDELMPNLAIVADGTDFSSPVLMRLHSECITGDIFHSLRCDCGEQLEAALSTIGAEGGVVLYLRQEGRGIGIINKLKAYQLQDNGADTVEANEMLGLPVDSRDYSTAIKMVKAIGIKKIRLLTNNPLKVEAFKDSGIEVVERVAIEIGKRPENEKYLNTKRDSMGHIIL